MPAAALIGTDFNEIYKNILHELVERPQFVIKNDAGEVEAHEITGLQLFLYNPYMNLVHSKTRNFNMEFAEKFYNWIMEGGTDPSALISSNSNVKKYNNLGKRNTSYGPRIIKQLPTVLEELKKNRNTRSAVIMILEADDIEVVDQKRKGISNMEYPCTTSIQYLIRENKLFSHVIMRSNNMMLTICYDFYNFTKLQIHVWEELKTIYPDLKLGGYQHDITSAHIFGHELEKAVTILKDYNIEATIKNYDK